MMQETVTKIQTTKKTLPSKRYRPKKIPPQTMQYDSCPVIAMFADYLSRFRISTPTGSETWKNVNRALSYMEDYISKYQQNKNVEFRTALDAKVFDNHLVENDDSIPPIFKSVVESMFYHKRVNGEIDNYHYLRAKKMRDELAELKMRYRG